MNFITLIVLIFLFLNFSFAQNTLYKFCDGINIYKAPSATSCSRYHFCVPGVEFFNWECRNGYHFNVEANECIHPHLANCVLPCPEIDIPGSPMLQPHYGDCSKYYVCEKRQAILQRCNSGYFFNANNSQCVSIENADCGIRGNGTVTMPPILSTTQATETTSYNPNPSVCPDATGPFFYPSPLECRNFTACFDGWKIYTRCSTGYQFDYLLNACLVNAVCYGSDPQVTSTLKQTSTKEQTNSASEQTSTISPTMEQITTSNSITSTDMTTSRKPENFKCPPEAGIFYLPHITDCRKYYKCNLGMAHLLVCETGLKFDHIEKVCKENANCYISP